MGPWSVGACGWEPVPARLQQVPLARGPGTRPAWALREEALRPGAAPGVSWSPKAREPAGSGVAAHSRAPPDT